MATPALFGFEAVDVVLDGALLLDGITADIPTVGITRRSWGPSGAGKSTLLRLCNRLVQYGGPEGLHPKVFLGCPETEDGHRRELHSPGTPASNRECAPRSAADSQSWPIKPKDRRRRIQPDECRAFSRALSCTLSSSTGSLAQLAEQRAFNPLVVGSSPTGPTVNSPTSLGFLMVAGRTAVRSSVSS